MVKNKTQATWKKAKKIRIKIKTGNNDIKDLKEKSSEIKDKSKSTGEELKTIEKEIQNILVNIPNIPDSKVPEGNSENENIEILKVAANDKYGNSVVYAVDLNN